MIARLQALIVLLLLMGAAIAMVAPLQQGDIAKAVVPLIAVSLVLPLVLALEFALLPFGRAATDPTPEPQTRDIVRAWLGETSAALATFAWRQPFRSQAWPDHLPVGMHQGDQPPRGVLLVHGFFCNRGLWNPWLARLTGRGVPTLAINLEPWWSSIDAYTQQVDEAISRLEQLTGQAPVIVAHSMGGLAVRAWARDFGPITRVHHVITVGTPHHGTRLAALSLLPNGKQMRRDSGWLRGLAASEPAGLAARMTCFYSNTDNIVFTPVTATLPGARNCHLPGVGHVDMIHQPAVWDAVAALLDGTDRPGPPSTGR